MTGNGNDNDKDECFWNAIDNYRRASRDANADDKTRRDAADKFFGHESMVKIIGVILSFLRRGKSPYECQFVGELLNDILLRVMQGIADFRGDNEKDFGRWLWQIIHDASASSFNATRTERQVVNGDFDVVEYAFQDYPSGRVLLKEWSDTLSELQRFIMDLRVAGHTYEEIAESLGLSISHTQREAVTLQKALVAMLGRVAPKAARLNTQNQTDNLKGEKRDEQ